MNNTTIVWLTIIGMALATFATRVTALLVLRQELAPWLSRWLGFVPVAVFTALILPPLISHSEAGQTVLAFGPALPAGVVGVLVAWRTNNILLTIGAGMIVFWLLRLVWV